MAVAVCGGEESVSGEVSREGKGFPGDELKLLGGNDGQERSSSAEAGCHSWRVVVTLVVVSVLRLVSSLLLWRLAALSASTVPVSCRSRSAEEKQKAESRAEQIAKSRGREPTERIERVQAQAHTPAHTQEEKERQGQRQHGNCEAVAVAAGWRARERGRGRQSAQAHTTGPYSAEDGGQSPAGYASTSRYFSLGRSPLPQHVPIRGRWAAPSLLQDQCSFPPPLGADTYCSQDEA